MHRLLLLLGTLLLLSLPAFAREVTLAWDPNTEPDIAGYKIYYKAATGELPLDGSGAAEGSSPIDVGNATQATVSGLAPAEIYYFAVTAYNDAGYESSFSNMVATEPLPVLLTPEEGSEVPAPRGTFTWSYDSENTDVTYTLSYGTDPTFDTSVQSVVFIPGSPLFPGPAAAIAAALALSALLLHSARKRRVGAAAVAAFGMALCLSACGGGGGESVPFLTGGGDGDSIDGGSTGEGDSGNPGGDPAPPPTRIITGLTDTYHEVFDLEAGKTFYWKVVAHDGGQDRESEVGSFTVY